MMKKITLWAMILALTLSLLAGCKSTQEDDFSASGVIDDSAEEETEKEEGKEQAGNKPDADEKEPSNQGENVQLPQEGDTPAEKEESKEDTPADTPAEDTPSGNTPAKDLTLSHLQDAAKEICQKWGVTYLDLYTHEKLNADLKFDTKEHTNDLLHPDASGYELITPYVIEYTRTMTPCPQEILAKCIK